MQAWILDVYKRQIVDYSYLHMKLYLTEIPQHLALLYPELPDIFLPHLRL